MDNIKNLSNEELIELFKNNNCSLSSIDNNLGLYKNYSLRLFRKRGIDYLKIKEEETNRIKEEYEKSPNLCKHCKKPLLWEKRNQMYCSSSCAASENNKGVVRNPNGYYESIKQEPKGKICSICGEENCSNDFCKKHSLNQIRSMVDHLGFNKSTIGTKKVFQEYSRIRNLVYNLYWVEGYSRLDLGKRFNYSNNLMPSKILKNSLEIPTRTLSEAVQNSIQLNKYDPPNSTKFLSQTYTTWTGDVVFLRSSYEKIFAEKLDSSKILYRVEYLRVEYYDSQKDRIRVAVPDFYLPDTNEIIEIKSDFTLDIQEMRDKFSAYRNLGYFPKLVLENEEIDLENLENLIDEARLNKIKTKNINNFRNI